jgi:hypothetical protein
MILSIQIAILYYQIITYLPDNCMYRCRTVYHCTWQILRHPNHMCHLLPVGADDYAPYACARPRR